MRALTLKSTVLMAIVVLLTACGEQSGEDTAMDETSEEAATEAADRDQTMQSSGQETAREPVPATDFSEAVAVIHPTEGNEVAGHVTVSKVADGIRVMAEISGLSEGAHGFHIHEFGDCRAADGTSAGGHYAPDEGSRHGAPDDADSHDGDLGNIVAGEEGEATLELTSDDITLNGAKSVIGRSIVIHGGEDDFESQPSGAAGPRVACGVIGIGNPGE